MLETLPKNENEEISEIPYKDYYIPHVEVPDPRVNGGRLICLETCPYVIRLPEG